MIQCKFVQSGEDAIVVNLKVAEARTKNNINNYCSVSKPQTDKIFSAPLQDSRHLNITNLAFIYETQLS